MSAEQGALFPQGARPWNDEQEAKRLGTIAAGFEPRLFHCWSSTSTESLTATLAEVSEKMPEELDLIADLRADLAYRGWA
jgi:hypothetical protein